jgi:hypothetical protein
MWLRRYQLTTNPQRSNILSGLEFTSLALRRNFQDPHEELQVSFSKAYEMTLQKHHNMFIRPIFHVCPMLNRSYHFGFH